MLFFTLTSRFGSRLLNLIRTRPRDFQGLFISFSLGTAALVAFMMW